MPSLLGFQFSEQQQKFAIDQLNQIQSSTGVQLNAQTGNAEGFDFFVVALHMPNDPTNPDMTVFTVISMPGLDGVGFSGRKGDGGVLGPLAIYDSFEEVFTYGLALTRSVCSKIARGLNVPLAPPPAADGVFSEDEKAAFQTTCNTISVRSGLHGYFEIVPLTASASTVGFGATNGNTERVPFASLVKSIENGKTVVTIRGLNGKELPDAPQTFPSVDAALTFSSGYFEFMSAQLRPFEGKEHQANLRQETLDGAKNQNTVSLAARVASLAGIIGMFIVFGVICSLLGFAAYFLSKSKIGTGKAIFLAIAVALVARVFFRAALK